MLYLSARCFSSMYISPAQGRETRKSAELIQFVLLISLWIKNRSTVCRLPSVQFSCRNKSDPAGLLNSRTHQKGQWLGRWCCTSWPQWRHTSSMHKLPQTGTHTLGAKETRNNIRFTVLPYTLQLLLLPVCSNMFLWNTFQFQALLCISCSLNKCRGFSASILNANKPLSTLLWPLSWLNYSFSWRKDAHVSNRLQWRF